MTKENAKIYEEMQFDNYAYAMETKANAEEQLKKIEKIWLIAIVGSICGVLGFFMGFNGVPMLISFIMACVCYHHVGGFLVAARWSWNFAKFGWFVVPYFPIDLGVGLTCFFIGLYGFFFVPFFVVRHIKKQANMNIEAADEYMKFCKPQENSDVID